VSEIPPERNRISLIDPETRARLDAYWRRNVRYVVVLLAIWFVVSYGFGIVLAEPLNAFTIPGTGFPLGFWFAQQGSIYVFVALIFVYVWLMNRLDREFDVDEGDAVAATGPTPAAGEDGP
jgi:putative solute:sodium symporter small subunit